jgi:phage terminase large subunit-like protein
MSFIEKFGIITKDSVGGSAGEKLVLRDWQKELISHMFASDESGLRHRVNFVGMPRKSGKSALGSSIALASLTLGPKGGEVYSVAATKEQARIIFSDAKRMAENSPDLKEIFRFYRDAIEFPDTGSVYRVLAAEAYSAEGLSSTQVIVDEVHALGTRALWDVMSLSMGARGKMANMIGITTAGSMRDQTGGDSIAYTLYQYGKACAMKEIDDPTFFMAWWESEGDYKNPETWRKANPGFGDLSDPADFESAVRRTTESEFKTKRLNIWTSGNDTWLPDGEWDKLGDPNLSLDPEEEIVLGFDGSFANDCTALVAVTIPKDGQKAKIVPVGLWEKDLNNDGPEWRVDIGDVEDTIIKFFQDYPKTREIVCDPFRWQRSIEVLAEKGLPMVEYYSSSPRRMVPASQKFLEAVLDSQLTHNGDPALSRHIENCIVKTDQLGPRIVKDKKFSPRKIDLAVCAVIAYDRATHIGTTMEEVVPQFFG